MNTQLRQIENELRAASDLLRDLTGTLPAEEWHVRIHPERWSVAECVAHLNLTSEAYLPRLRDALPRARNLGGEAAARYRRDPVGWLLWKSMGPPVRMKTRTTAAFVPQAELPLEVLVGEFNRLQNDLLAFLPVADGLPLHKVKLQSPFNERISYNVFSALGIIPRHQHRHLWQAKQLLGMKP